MAWEHREGSGSLFKNDQKGNEKAPGYRGEILLGGVLYELAGWVKEGNTGKFFSLAGKPKEAKQAKPQGSIADMDSDIPFN